MLLVTGKKYAGKTTIKNKIARELWLKNATVYTTRKKTAQDIFSMHCRFITPNEFTLLQSQGLFKFVTTDAYGGMCGVLNSEFEKADTILEIDFDTFSRIFSSLPSSCKVVFVDANVEIRFDRMLKDKKSIPSSFDLLHKENFKGYDLPFGIIVDNSLNDNGENATRNAIKGVSSYTNTEPVVQQSVQAKRKYITPLVPVPYTTETRKFLAYEQWAIQDIRRVCNLDNADGREFAKIMYRNYLTEYRSLGRVDFNYNPQNKELSVVLDGMHFPLIKDEELMPELRGKSKVKSPKSQER